MRKASLDAGVPTAILSRQSAGIVKQSLVVNLPGKPGSIRVCLDAIFPAVPYCIDLIGGPYLEGNPEFLINTVVRRMLPKTRMGRQMLRRLKVYNGPHHSHQAQQFAVFEAAPLYEAAGY